MWILGMLPAVESDLSAFHGIRDPYQIPSSRFFELASMLPLYPGAVQRLFQVELAKETAPVQPALPTSASGAFPDITQSNLDGQSFGSFISDFDSPFEYSS